jgi:hypothetical protein
MKRNEAEKSRLPSSYGFNFLYFKRFWKLQKYLFPSFCSDSVALLILLLVVAGGEQFLVYKVGLISGKILNA